MSYDAVIDSSKLNGQMAGLADIIRGKCGLEKVLAWPDDYNTAVAGMHVLRPNTSGILDPEVVYHITRPSDWLPMPTPADDEIYMLCLIPEGLDGAFTCSMTFSGACTIDFGNLVNGVFVAKESLTPTRNVRLYHTVCGDDYGDITSDGYRQYFVRIKGEGFTFINLAQQEKVAFASGFYGMVDFASGIYSGYRIGGFDPAVLSNNTVRYVRFTGNGGLTDTAMTFRNCTNLLSVYTERKSSGTSANYMFSGCTSLLAVSDSIFPQSATYQNTFGSYMTVPKINENFYTNVTDATAMFRYGETTFVDGNKFDTSACKNFTNFLSYSTIAEAVNLNISSMTTTTNMFVNTRLRRLTFAGETTPGGWAIDLSACYLSHKALLNMINSLPTAIASATITLTGNPGVAELTQGEIAVATAKNWTITI